jgi:hypothetical protein
MRIAGGLTAAFDTQLTPIISRGWLRSGGGMLTKIALVVLIAWLLGVVGLYRIGDLVHVLLLVGLLLLLGTVRARDAAVSRGRDVGSDRS